MLNRRFELLLVAEESREEGPNGVVLLTFLMEGEADIHIRAQCI